MFLDSIDDIDYISSKEEYDKLHYGCDDIYVYQDGLVLSNIGECKIAINGYAGNTPHFEIISKDKKFKTCIKIFEPEYYFRNNLEFIKLNNNQIDELIKYFLEIDKFGECNFGWISILWKNLNTGKKYDHYNEKITMPDYNKLKE